MFRNDQIQTEQRAADTVSRRGLMCAVWHYAHTAWDATADEPPHAERSLGQRCYRHVYGCDFSRYVALRTAFEEPICVCTL